MTHTSAEVSGRFDPARKLALLALIVCVMGLPLNDLFWFTILVVAAVLIFAGRVRTHPRAWALACLLTAVAVGVQMFLAPPQIDEGHNVFLVDEKADALATGLPPDAYRLMAAEFNKLYPPDKRCNPATPGCWRGGGFPDRAYAFSADGLYERGASRGPSKGEFSRRVSDIDFHDPVWLRLGFTNEMRYNWEALASDVKRLRRDSRLWSGLQRWHLLMPYFVMYRFPAAYAGSQLCWHGDLIWEERPDRFTLLSNTAWACRTVEPSDIGNRIFGLGIRPDTLAMTLDPPVHLRLWQWAYGLLKIVIVASLIVLLVRRHRGPLALPFALLALSVLMVALHDASFLGGLRPLDAGDDGLFYESTARDIVQHLMAGDFRSALRGGESVFYYGGPGLRYLRAAERLVFGDTNLGYLALVLVMPLVLLALYRRFLPGRWALVLGVMFVVVPLGAVFGTTFLHYSRWAVRGFADPAAAIAALCAVTVLVGRSETGPDRRFAPAFGAGLLFALAVFVRPNLAPFCAVMLTGAGLAALYFRQRARVAGLCLGFLPFAVMPLHNWYFGNVFVLFSTNSAHPLTYIMPPAAWASALSELARLQFAGEHAARGAHQVMNWLAGPSELWIFAPLHAGAVAVLVHVALRARGYDPWLRLIAAASLAQHAVALFYIATPRYHYFTWLMTGLVVAVWLQREGLPYLQRRWPEGCSRWRLHPLNVSVASGLRRIEHAAGVTDRR